MAVTPTTQIAMHSHSTALRPFSTLISALIVAGLVTACGGGGGSESSQATASVAPTPDNAASASSADVSAAEAAY